MPTVCDTPTHTDSCWWHPLEARWVCPRPAWQAVAPPPVDTRDMLVVHAALLREFRLTPAAVDRVADGDRAAARVVDRHLGFLCDMLHHHHAGEDELLWPLLRDRLPAEALAAVEQVEAQHDGIDAALAAVGHARAAWTADAGEGNRRTLSDRLRHLHGLLHTHLDHEERVVLPLAAAAVTTAEWNAVGEAAAASLPKPDLVLALGMFAYEGDPAVVRTMLASAPAVARVVVPRLGPRLYARRARAVHGTSRP